MAIKNKRTAPADWLVVHRMDRSRPLDAGTLRGLRVTNPAVTLLDLAGVLPSEELEFALEDALRRKLTTVLKLEAALRRLGRKGVTGTKPLRRLVTERGSGYVPTASQLEVRVNRILERCSLPRAEREFFVSLTEDRSAHIDFAYPDIKLGIEVDGYGAHVGSKRRWQRDMHRENALKRLGWIILHFSWEDVRDRPTMVESEIRRWLAQRRLPLSALV